MHRIGRSAGVILGMAGIWGYSIHALHAQGFGNGREVAGSGVFKSESRAVSGFTGVALEGVGKVVITQDGREAVAVHAEDNLLPLLTTRVVNGVLRLGKTPNINLRPKRQIEFDISVKKLTDLTLSGAGNISASKLAGRELTVSLSGAGNITPSGTVTGLRLTLSGAGNFEGANLQAQQASVTNSGAGQVTVNASRQLTINLSGVGNVEYLGSPQLKQTLSGVGHITRRR